MNHQDVRADILLAELTELDGIINHDNPEELVSNKGRAKKLKNKGGKTAVTIGQVMKN